MKGFYCDLYSHSTLHFGVRQRSKKIILHQILDEYPRINFINKGLSIVQKLHFRCDSLDVFFGAFTDINKVSIVNLTNVLPVIDGTLGSSSSTRSHRRHLSRVQLI